MIILPIIWFLKFFLLSRFHLVFLPPSPSFPPGVMLLNRTTTARERTSQKGAPEREWPNRSVVKIVWKEYFPSPFLFTSFHKIRKASLKIWINFTQFLWILYKIWLNIFHNLSNFPKNYLRISWISFKTCPQINSTFHSKSQQFVISTNSVQNLSDHTDNLSNFPKIFLDRLKFPQNIS